MAEDGRSSSGGHISAGNKGGGIPAPLHQDALHLTYKAFAELGKAIKAIFLCRYLHDKALRRG